MYSREDLVTHRNKIQKETSSLPVLGKPLKMEASRGGILKKERADVEV